MRLEFVFKVPVDVASVREGIRLFFRGEGYAEEPQEQEDGATALVFARGSPWRRLLSLRTENWPTRLRAAVVPMGTNAGAILRYEIRSGWHLVGSLDLAVIETEVACLEEYLATGRRRRLEDAVGPLRRPVLTEVAVNVLLASLIIVWVGIMGGYPAPWIALVAAGVALLDGIVILAFADILIDGVRRLPRLEDRSRR